MFNYTFIKPDGLGGPNLGIWGRLCVMWEKNALSPRCCRFKLRLTYLFIARPYG